jgi:DNA mismatch endonuclease (patch repair protein)
LHQLRAAGWRTLTIWECAIRGKGAIGMDRVIAQTSKWLQQGLRDKIICGACHGAL